MSSVRRRSPSAPAPGPRSAAPRRPRAAATSPAGSAGVVDLTVTTAGGTSTISSADHFTYDATPSVTAVSPNAGPIAGGTVVTVSGTGFADSIATTGVTFAGNNATSYTINSDTSITATSPAHAAGVADVVVTNETGSSSTSSADHFSYEALPSVTGISPAAGTTNGGDVVTITGTGFVVGSTTVAFGAGAGTSVTCASTTSCSATSPAGSAGVVDLTVTTAGGTSTISSADHFTYDATPSVTAVSPNAGPIAGGTVVTVSGTGFADSIATTGVTFAGNNATSYTINSDTSITATSPAHAAGVADVVVTNETGSSSTSSADHFSYEALPSVTGISPAAGTTNGGDVVTITGTGFVVGSTTVAFGAGAGTSVTCASTTSCSATSPAGSAGVVDLTVTTAGGTSTISSADHFTYDATPSVTAVSPAAGPIAGGTVVTVSGTGFADSIATTGVTFAGNNATSYTINSDTSITATSPAHAAGVADVVVTNETGSSSTSSADHFSYEALPSVTGISPAAGTTNGGDVVTITGTGFVVGSTTVAFGAGAGTSVSCTSTTSCSATSPAGSAGVVDLTVTTAGGTSTISSADHFTYDATPSVTAVSPNAGPIAGGTVVTVSGTGFADSIATTGVTFAGNNATSYTINSDTSITATSPAHAAGVADVVVTNETGSSSTSSADHFSYEAVPSVTGISPAAGTTNGGDVVTITGTGFVVGSTTVAFGAGAGTSVTCTSTTSCSATSPAGSAGVVDLTVTTAGGTSTISSADHFTYDATPSVTAVSPAAGPIAGGTVVTVSGTGFADSIATTGVTFAGNNATSYTINSDTSITATSPAHAAGVADVVVTNETGTSSISSADHFTYDATPSVTAVSPAAGPITGATVVTITGTGFMDAIATTGVRFAGNNAASYTINSDTSITATSPAHAAVVADIIVTNETGLVFDELCRPLHL